jgi:Leucine-rich repeat (LRR) protein
MKKYFIFFLFLASILNGQNIIFTDNNLKNALTTFVCVDINNDGNPDSDADIDNNGEISVSEALLVNSLFLENKNISSLNGLEYFTNLETLDVYQNLITTINFANFPNLKDIAISNNHLTNITIANNNVIKYIFADNNQISSVDITNCNSLDAISLIANQISSINLQSLPLLTNLSLSNNQLTSFNAYNFPELITLEINNNNLTSLNFSNSNKIQLLYCTNNNLTTLNLSNLLHLSQVRCYNNNLQSVNLQNTPLLNNFWCQNNNITSLDFSTSPSLAVLVAENNSLVYLNLKNGTLGTTYAICGNPNLSHICVDNINSEIQHLTIQVGPNYCAYTGVNIDPICSLFTYEISHNYFDIYPNPFSDFIYIKSDKIIGENIEIVNSIGQTVLKEKITSTKINLSRLAKGIYYLKLSSKNNVLKIIKNKF